MSYFSGISKLSRCELLTLTNTLSIALSKELNQDDLNVLGNLVVSIGSIILTFGALPSPPPPDSAPPEKQ